MTLSCIAGPYDAPTNVGSDHASLGPKETQDVFIVRNMWSRCSNVVFNFGFDVPPGYQGTTHEGGPGGVTRMFCELNYGPWRHLQANPGTNFNVTDQNNVHLTTAQTKARNPGMFEQPIA